MKRLLADFSHTLRQAGVPVSSAETLDAARALEHLTPLDQHALYHGLRATLVKSLRHHDAFDRCFQLFFDTHEAQRAGLHIAGGADPTAKDPSDGQDTELDDAEGSGELSNPFNTAQAARELEERWEAQRAALLDDAPEELTDPGDIAAAKTLRDALLALLDDDDPGVLAALEALGSGEMPGGNDEARDGEISGLWMLSQRLRAIMVIKQMREALRRFVTQQATGDATRDAVARRWLERRERRLSQASQWMLDEAPRRDTRVFSHTEQEGLRGRGLAELFWRDRERLIELMQRLARKLATVHSRRQRRQRRGQLDVKRTLRASLRTGAVPINLHHRNKRDRKGDLVVLADVSGSVRSMAQTTLAMIHALAGVWSQLRVFAFTDDIIDISARIDHYDPEEVLRRVMTTPLVQSPVPSNYGRAFRRFEAEVGSQLGPRTTLLIMGDARNNGHLTEHRLVARWQKRARRVLWLNPEPAEFWDSGDSEASAYIPFCTEFHACHTFGQLEDFVASL